MSPNLKGFLPYILFGGFLVTFLSIRLQAQSDDMNCYDMAQVDCVLFNDATSSGHESLTMNYEASLDAELDGDEIELDIEGVLSDLSSKKLAQCKCEFGCFETMVKLQDTVKL
jgi:hypothetical protein